MNNRFRNAFVMMALLEIALSHLGCTVVQKCPVTRRIVSAPDVETDVKDRPSPRLIVQITVDQLRGDILFRHGDHLSDWGLGYFVRNGIWYDNAHFGHANTVTVTGHTSLATGAYPSDHGMIGNDWYDPNLDQIVHNIQDDSVRILDSRIESPAGPGRSPRAIMASTFSDELLMHFGGQSKIFAVSVKDRGAVPMSGHGGKAFWYSTQSGSFVSSSWYYDTLPDWVAGWNDLKHADRWKQGSWSLLRDRNLYVFKDQDDRPFERDLNGFGRTFPHSFAAVPDDAYYYMLANSPMGDTLTAEFAEELLAAEKLGTDEIPDYLSVSFSATDYVGHNFGPSSLEYEDNILRLDRTISRLITTIAETVGLEHTLFVLSADHGTPEAPECVSGLGMGARRLDPETVARTAVAEALKHHFGEDASLIRQIISPYVYLDGERIREKKLDRLEVARVIADAFQSVDGIAHAVATGDLHNGNVFQNRLTDQLSRNYYPGRSGDVHFVQDSYWHMQVQGDADLLTLHGSPWRYDTYVPIVFAGNGLSRRRISRPVDPVNIAATLSTVLGVKPPSKSQTDSLAEVLDAFFNIRPLKP